MSGAISVHLLGGGESFFRKPRKGLGWGAREYWCQRCVGRGLCRDLLTIEPPVPSPEQEKLLVWASWRSLLFGSWCSAFRGKTPSRFPILGLARVWLGWSLWVLVSWPSSKEGRSETQPPATQCCFYSSS